MDTHYVPTTRWVFAFCWLSSKILAIPKSAILGFISTSNKIFPTLRSLWIMVILESLWRYRSPLATPLMILNRVAQSNDNFLESSKKQTNVSKKYFWAILQNHGLLLECVPKSLESKLLFGRYSYIKSFSFPASQHPRSRTKFLCCSFAIRITSFLNSFVPCWESVLSLLTATCWPPNSP